MKKLKYLLFIFLLFPLKVNASILVVDDSISMSVRGSSATPYSYFYKKTNFNINSSIGANPPYTSNFQVPANSSVNFWVDVLINGNHYGFENEAYNMQGVRYYMNFNICSTGSTNLTNPIHYTSGNFRYYKDFGFRNDRDCVIKRSGGDVSGKIVSKTVEFVCNKSTLNTNYGGYQCSGTQAFNLSPHSSYSYYEIISLDVYRSTNRILESLDIGEKQSVILDTTQKDTRSILQKITSLPSDIWNFMKNIPSQVWGFFSSALSDIGEFILGLPFGIWNWIQDGFNWITDSIGNLFDFFSTDDDPDLSLLDDMVGVQASKSGEMTIQSSGWLPPGPVDSVLNLPFTFLNNFNDNLSKNCQAVDLPLPYINQNLPLPCVNSLYGQITGLNVWISSISVILSAFILFKYFINLYKWVDDTLSFRENNHLDNWGGV